jgi:CRISPR-associated exonuclease Cas4
MMQIGIDEEAERRRLEARRTFDQYGIEAVSRRNQVPVSSDRLGMRGMVDTLLELSTISLEAAAQEPIPTVEQLFVPVEFKTTTRSDQRYNTIQLATYSICIEEMTNSPVEYAFLVLLPDEEVIRQSIGPHIRRSVEDLVAQVREGLDGDELPAPPLHKGRCQSCEFRRFCNDVW